MRLLVFVFFFFNLVVIFDFSCIESVVFVIQGDDEDEELVWYDLFVDIIIEFFCNF